MRLGAPQGVSVLLALQHHVEPHRPEELWVMMCEVSLSRVEELLFGSASELRPALAIRDPTVFFVDRGHLSSVTATLPDGVPVWAPLSTGGPWPPVATDRNLLNGPLAIRFHNVAGTGSRG